MTSMMCEEADEYSSCEEAKAEVPQLTVRAVLVGLLTGSMLCFTNMYFGLQTGWVTMGSIQAAVVGFGIFRLFGSTTFGPLENVVLQTVSVATATMPLAAGFVGILPALGMLDPPVVLNVWQQLAWCAAMTYFGIFFAVPLRRQTILVEKLPFPSGTATASLIKVLHSSSDTDAEADDLHQRYKFLGGAFAASFGLSLLGFFWPAGLNWKVATCFGLPAVTNWCWTLRPSLSYVGQGMIMGLNPALSMLAGAVTGWAILGPIAKDRGWAPGAITDWKDGAQGWILWLAIGVMLAEALSSLCLMVFTQLFAAPHGEHFSSGSEYDQVDGADSDAETIEVAKPSELVPAKWWGSGVALACALAVSVLSPLFDIPAWQVATAVALSCLVAVLAVRALGQTDLNPVSGVGKLSQIVFALLAPGHVVTNVVAGALAEAGAMQVGDLMQDLKAGHLLGASPRAQFFSQLIGSTASIPLTVMAYNIYYDLYGIPSDQFPAPVSHVWKDMAELMQSGLDILDPSCRACALAFAVVGGILPILEHFMSDRVKAFLPSGMAFGIGMYITPDWTLPRVAGAVADYIWRQRNSEARDKFYLMVASGFVLGEGFMSIFALILKALDAPELPSGSFCLFAEGLAGNASNNSVRSWDWHLAAGAGG